MTERGLPSADASPACPFVAFDDDRDARADRPDHRHRCFAEPEPAPRALAHQEAYCLSSAFPVCPTFQAWARREAAQARSDAAAAAAGGAAAAGAATDGGGAGATGPSGAEAGAQGAAARPAPADEWTSPPSGPDVPIEATPRRNPPRDWAAPPPWATGAGAAGAAPTSAGTGGVPDPIAPRPPAEGQGLAGSAADRLARGGTVTGTGLGSGSGAGAAPVGPASRPTDIPSAPPDPELAGLVAGGRVGRDEGAATAPPAYPPATRSGRRPSVSSTRANGRPPAREHVQSHEGPSWESARRYEAYPQIKSRAGLGGLPSLPRVALLAGALGIAALALFFLPALFGVGGGDDPSPSPTVSAAPATPTPAPTPEPEPTPQTYTIKEGDTLSKIAREFGITLQELLDANTETITDPDRISVGDVIIIPVPIPEEVEGGGASEEPAP